MKVPITSTRPVREAIKTVFPLLSPAASGYVPAELETMKKRLISREEAAQAVLDSQKEAEEALAKAEAKK